MTRTIEDLDLVSHTCCVPDSAEHSWEIAAAWLAGGLDAGERVMYFEDDTADRLLERFADDRVPVDRAMADGQFVLVPTEATRSTMAAPLDVFEQLIVDLVRDTETGGWPGLRLIGENISVQVEQGLDTVIGYESRVDRVLRAHPRARLLCRFDHQYFDDRAMAAVRAVHTDQLVVAPAVYDDGLLRVTRTGPDGLRLAGEADHSNRTVIRRVLATVLDESLRSGSAPVITLDLASLRFVDVSGVVGLVHTAEEFPDSHRLVLRGVRPRVLRALHRCGAAEARQLVVHPRPERAGD
jgi:anti-anti-sigma regulatory factor